jgi:hypothetical protein
VETNLMITMMMLQQLMVQLMGSDWKWLGRGISCPTCQVMEL